MRRADNTPESFFSKSGNSPGESAANANDAASFGGLTATYPLPDSSLVSRPSVARSSSPGSQAKCGQPAEISVVGSTQPALVESDDHEFLSQWTWYEVPGPFRTHFVTVIDCSCVDMAEVVLWAGLVQGARFCEHHGGLTGNKRRTIPTAALRKMLEDQLQDAPLQVLIGDLIEKALSRE